MATGDIQIIENKNGRAKFPVTHFRAVFNDDGENLEEFLADYTGGGGIVIKGSVASVSQLPSTGQSGDAYLVGEDLYLWVGSGQGDEGTPSTAWHNGGPVRGPKGEDGVGFQSISSQQDGTIVITLTDGNTITIDLNHNHPQYLKYEYLEDESEMPATPDEDTLYLIQETSE